MLKYIHGDATDPIITPSVNSVVCIPHICNNGGYWGSGFTRSLDEKWELPRKSYLNMNKYNLGEVVVVKADNNISNLYVLNMIAQKGIRSRTNPKPISYSALDMCLNKLKIFASTHKNITFHMPKIGSGLAGGDWNIIEEMINNIIVSTGTDVYVYLYEGKN